jgi:CHAT domain-containing protein
VLSDRCSRDLDREVLFKPLTGAGIEGENIARMLHVAPLLGADVLEGTIKGRHSPCIFHLATHGAFFPDQLHPFTEDVSSGMLAFESSDRLRHLSRLENPLLRSFLAMAGVNTWLKGKKPPVMAEDGLLTAEDVSGLDLTGTELVVLSACETALGSVHAGEGVFGLQRAFVMAGARTLLMSQWKVPDQETCELMEGFYARLLAGEGRAEALRNSKLAIKEKKPDPIYWGAFICQGDPGPLTYGISASA